MTQPEVFSLTREDRHSATWRKIHARLIEELSDLRAKNDDGSLSEFETAILRGRIGMLKYILDWDVDRTPEIKITARREYNGVLT